MMHPLWADASLALALLRVDPKGLGGIWLRARIGPPRERFLIAATTKTALRLSPDTPTDALFGGLDITQTLATGTPTYAQGLLNGPARRILLASAERTSPHLAAQLSASLPGHSLIALDEGIEDETLPACLKDRLAFHLNLDGLRARDCPPVPVRTTTKTSRATIDTEAIRSLTALATKLAIPSLRAPLFAIRAAKAHAALHGRLETTSEDLEIAVRLTLVPRANALPADALPPEPDPPEPPDPSDVPDEASAPETGAKPPEDILLEAALAALPTDVLASLQSSAAITRAPGASAQGALKKGGQRGRPLPARRGRPAGRNRIDRIATLRTAAPWQPLRQSQSTRAGLQIRPSDIHLKRHQSRSDRLLIFTVDASGSAAMNRLAEAKGAVELLLAEAYASRDHVALISYNKEAASLLLPPTRSLVRTKRQLAQLPGGGGTPLASGLRAALDLATTARRKGFLPALLLLADGRANIDLSGTASRASAREDALTTARLAATTRTPAVVIDMSKRPEPQLEEIARAMEARYTPMPYADARRLSTLVQSDIS